MAAVTAFGLGGGIWRPLDISLFGNKTPDVTAPVLSLATGTQTGKTTATGTVSTDEDNGTLYFWATTNAAETAADIQTSGDSQSVSATGEQAVSFTGLTAGTVYYAHYVQLDAATNESNVVTSSTFTTVSDKSPTGGFWPGYDAQYGRQAAAREERGQKRRKAQEIQDDLERLIAFEQRRIEEDEAKQFELESLTEMVRDFKGSLRKETNDRIEFIAKQAVNRRTFSAMQRLQRELSMLREEEEFLMLAIQVLLNE